MSVTVNEIDFIPPRLDIDTNCPIRGSFEFSLKLDQTFYRTTLLTLVRIGIVSYSEHHSLPAVSYMIFFVNMSGNK